LRLRESRPAAAIQRSEVLDFPSALRNQLPDDRDADLDIHLHAGARAWLLGKIRCPPRVVAGDRRGLVRDYSLCRKARKVTVCGHDEARIVAPAHHHSAAGRQPGSVRDYGPRRSYGARAAKWWRIGHSMKPSASIHAFASVGHA